MENKQNSEKIHVVVTGDFYPGQEGMKSKMLFELKCPVSAWAYLSYHYSFELKLSCWNPRPKSGINFNVQYWQNGGLQLWAGATCQPCSCCCPDVIKVRLHDCFVSCPFTGQQRKPLPAFSWEWCCLLLSFSQGENEEERGSGLSWKARLPLLPPSWDFLFFLTVWERSSELLSCCF